MLFCFFLQDMTLIKIDLGNSRFATVNIFRGKAIVHIRQYDIFGSNSYPSRTGVCLTPSRFARMLLSMEEIDAHVDQLKGSQDFDYKIHIGGGIYCSVRAGFYCVNIRKYFIPVKKHTPIPTKRGISLRINEWKNLKSNIDIISKSCDELRNARPCYECESTHNKNGLFGCNECYPFGLYSAISE